MKEGIRVLVVDDLDVVRTGLCYLLEDVAEIEVVGAAKNGKEAMNLVKELLPDVVLLDFKMPDSDCLDVTQRMLRAHPKAKILILTAHSNAVYPRRLFDMGVLGYVTKDIDEKELIAAIKSVYAGKRYISSHMAKQLFLQKIDSDTKTPFDVLNNRELQVVLMVAKGCHSKEIAERLNLSLKTINSYRYRIFDSLQIDSDVELARLAIQYGIIDVLPPLKEV